MYVCKCIYKAYGYTSYAYRWRRPFVHTYVYSDFQLGYLCVHTSSLAFKYCTIMHPYAFTHRNTGRYAASFNIYTAIERCCIRIGSEHSHQSRVNPRKYSVEKMRPAPTCLAVVALLLASASSVGCSVRKTLYRPHYYLCAKSSEYVVCSVPRISTKASTESPSKNIKSM